MDRWIWNLEIDRFKTTPSQRSLKQRLTFLFGLFSIIACGTVAMGLSFSAKGSILSQYEKSLTSMSDAKIEALQTLFEKYEQDAESISVAKYFQDAIVAMESVAYGTGVDLTTDSDLSSSTYYKPLADKYAEVFKEYITQFKIKNFMAVLNTGTIIAQGLNSDFVGANVIAGRLKDSAIAKCYQSAKMNKNKTYFQDLSVVKKDQPMTVLACRAILSKYNRDGYNKDAVMGVLVLELDWEAANNLIKNSQGLGPAGQIYVLGEDQKTRLGTELLQLHSNEVISQASAKDAGIIVGEAEKDNQVMTAFKSVNLHGFHWKLFSEIKMSEILSPIYSMYRLTFLISLIISSILALLGYLVSNQISKRLEQDAADLDTKIKRLLEMSVHLSEASQTLASSSTEQASSMEETVSTLTEFSSIVKQNTNSTKTAAAESDKSRLGIETGKAEISRLVITMREMEVSSRKIEEIINVIDGIAFQTNLLALNAAVEAARAGEQGKGFAVVADAVQSLAQRSTEAAKNITLLITESVSHIQNGVQTVENNNRILTDVFESVTNLARLNEQIASSIEEQSMGIDQISIGMNQLDTSAQVNVSTSEKLSGSAQQLQDAAHDLTSLVNNLKGTVLGA